MILTHKTECFPNKEQIEFIEKMFGDINAAINLKLYGMRFIG